MRNDTSDVRRSLVSIENTTHVDGPNLEEDQVSLQPGQRERRSLGLMSSDEDEQSSGGEQGHSEQGDMSRFGKYTAQTNSEKDNGPLTHDMLVEMFGEDAQSNSSASKKGLCLDKAQVDILNSWRCQFPDKLSAYRETNKQSFPISESAEKTLQVPSLDALSERLLIKKHGRKAAFGSSQSLFFQPYKSMEKIAYQGQVAARLGIVTLCYTQQVWVC